MWGLESWAGRLRSVMFKKACFSKSWAEDKGDMTPSELVVRGGWQTSLVSPLLPAQHATSVFVCS